MPTLYSDLLLDHYRHPRNYGSLPEPEIAHEDVNPLCGDRIRIELAIRGRVVEAARFRGDACLISIAAASILTEMIVGAEIDREEMISDEQFFSSLRTEIQPARIKCALLPLETLRAGLEIYRQSHPESHPESHSGE
jgi:nitrogen fixation NifU-like protein